MSVAAETGTTTARGRSAALRIWYESVRVAARGVLWLMGGVRASGVENMPKEGGVLLVSNHASFWDVFALGVLLPRPLNYVARSTLFKPVLGAFIRSVGGFPIQRDGMGSQGFKETLKRLRAGGIVTLFPEGTRTPDGSLQPMKAGIGTLAARSKVPVVPAGLAGTFEAWPRGRRFPRRHPIRVHYGPPIAPAELAGMDHDAASELIGRRIAEAVAVAREALPGRD